MPSTAIEQYELELVNEARLNPLLDATQYLNSYVPLSAKQQNIQDALTQFSVSGPALLQAYQALTPTRPLAWNDSLGASAASHNQAMIAADQQTHQAPGEPELLTREQNAGYTGLTLGAENVYAYADDALYAQAGFMVDWGNADVGHRTNIMDPTLREIGIGITTNTNGDPGFGPLVVTEDFGTRGTSGVFILGVAYTDSDHNDFYSIGEGLAGLTASVGGLSTTSSSSGGYTLQTGAIGAQTVTLTGAGLAAPVTVGVNLVDGSSIKLDVVSGTILRTSTSAAVAGPISRIEGLGTLGLALSDTAAGVTFVGSYGADTFTGGANDVFEGTTAQLLSDTITDPVAGDRIHITDANFAAFGFNLAGTTLTFDPNAAANTPVETITLANDAGLLLTSAADPAGGVDLYVGSATQMLPTTSQNGVQIVAIGGGQNFVGTQYAAGTGAVLVDLPNGTVSKGGVVDAVVSTIVGVQLGADPSTVLGLTAGTDLLYGGSGADSFYGQGGTDYIHGGTGPNNVVGGSGNEIFYSGGGTDAMRGGSAANFMSGGSAPTSADAFYGTGGADYVYGHGGTMLLVGGDGFEYLAAGSGFNELIGSNKADGLGRTGLSEMVGGTGQNAGTDLFYAGIGVNLLYEGSGTDVLAGNAGTDYVYGGSGRSFVYGGTGTDVITTGAGNQYVEAGTGNTFFNDTAVNLTAGRFDQIDRFEVASGATGGKGTFLYLPQADAATTTFQAVNGGTAIFAPATGGSGTAELFVSNTSVASVQNQTHFTL